MSGFGGYGMAKLEMKGMDAYIKQLESIAGSTGEVCKAAVYAGAKVVADEIKTEMHSLKTTSEELALRAWQKKEPAYLTQRQKAGLIASFGLPPIREDMGAYDTKAGFDGYNDVVTKRWPNGQPNVLVARSVNNGSTAMIKQPFIRRAVDRVRGRVVKTMDDAANKKTQEILNR